jgi:SAM-dependent methyltransferase
MNRPHTTYDRIGHNYGVRRPDQRLAARLHALLGDARTVLNVGAGSGNYEPVDRVVIAAEPSSVMISRRPSSAAAAIQATAEHLPFPDASFDASMAVSTLHHWTDLRQGLRELTRVASLNVVYFSEPGVPGAHWLTDDYFPEILNLPTNLAAPRTDHVAELLGGTITIETFEIPHDFTDGGGAYWSRPELYCDPEIQSGLSMFALLDVDVVRRGTRQLQHDLESGRWDDRHGQLRNAHALDVGYRIVTSRR